MILRLQILLKTYIPGIDTYTESRHWKMRTTLHTHKVNTGPTSKYLCVRKASIVNTFMHSTINTFKKSRMGDSQTEI